MYENRFHQQYKEKEGEMTPEETKKLEAETTANVKSRCNVRSKPIRYLRNDLWAGAAGLSVTGQTDQLGVESRYELWQGKPSKSAVVGGF